jgi:hypothetical protein
MSHSHSPLRRQMVPPPAMATWGDAYRFGLGLLVIFVGITILARSLAAGVLTPPAVLTGLASIAFGIYRTGEGIVRYRLYKRQTTEDKRHG